MAKIGTFKIWFAVHKSDKSLHKGGPRLNRIFFDTRRQLMASLIGVVYGISTNKDALEKYDVDYREIEI